MVVQSLGGAAPARRPRRRRAALSSPAEIPPRCRHPPHRDHRRALGATGRRAASSSAPPATRRRPRPPSPRAFGPSTRSCAATGSPLTIPMATRSGARRRSSPGSGTAPARGLRRAAGRRPSRSPIPSDEGAAPRRFARRSVWRPCSPVASGSTSARRCCCEPGPTSTRAVPGRRRFSSAPASRRCSPSSRPRAPRVTRRGTSPPAGAPGEHRRSGPRGACGRAVRQARRRRRRDARHLRASPAPPPDPGRARVRAGYPRAASTELRASATSPSRRTEAAESYRVELLVTIATRPPFWRVSSGRPATG